MVERPPDLISIHAPAQGATPVHGQLIEPVQFQSTHPHRVRHPARTMARKKDDFNPRTRTGCDTGASAGWARSTNFNPRTRTGCDPEERDEAFVTVISIHAPAQGATPVFRDHCHRHGISIHAPAQGATLNEIGDDLQYLFQSTHPHRVRHETAEFPQVTYFISIHAPAQGATPEFIGMAALGTISIHAPAQGATLSSSAINSDILFQSTHPHRVRRLPTSFPSLPSLFQSTHPHRVRRGRSMR